MKFLPKCEILDDLFLMDAGFGAVCGGIGASQEYLLHPKTLTQLYPALLQRPAESSGLAFYQDQVDHGTGMTQVIAEIGASDEYALLHTNVKSAVDGAYSGLLDRSADAAGENFWTHIVALQSNAPLFVPAPVLPPAAGDITVQPARPLTVVGINDIGNPIIADPSTLPAATPGATWNVTQTLPNGTELGYQMSDDAWRALDSIYLANGLGNLVSAVQV